MNTNFQNRNYIILDITEVTLINFNEVLQDSISTLRKSLDGTKTFIKYDGNTIPSSISSLRTKKGPYSHEQMLTILSSNEWTEPDNEV